MCQVRRKNRIRNYLVHSLPLGPLWKIEKGSMAQTAVSLDPPCVESSPNVGDECSLLPRLFQGTEAREGLLIPELHCLILFMVHVHL